MHNNQRQGQKHKIPNYNAAADEMLMKEWTKRTDWSKTANNYF